MPLVSNVQKLSGSGLCCKYCPCRIAESSVFCSSNHLPVKALMDKETFKQHLQEASSKTEAFTATFCYNECPGQYRYRITPNSRVVDQGDEHLTGEELAVLQGWNKYENKVLPADQVVDLCWQGGKVPVWIDITVYECRSDYTLFDLFCSRRLRMDDELYYPGPVMPFHIQVVMPPDHLKIEQEGRFDINWKKRLDDRKEQHGITGKIRNFFKNKRS